MIRRGVTLIEVVVAVAIIAIVSAVITLNVGASSRTGGETERLEEVVLVLAKLADAIARFAGVGGTSSFAQVIGATNVGGVNPDRLSHLTRKIVGGTDRNSCGNTYTSTEATNWSDATRGGPFYLVLLPASGFKITDGFFADDTLSRYSATTRVPEKLTPNSYSAVGTLAIVMQNVSISDARSLAVRVEGDQAGVIGAVRFTPNGDAPVTVYYHMNIHGC